MDVADYVTLDATAMADLVRQGELSPDELRRAAGERHLATHHSINAVVEWYDDPAPPSSLAGPLAGVAFLRKDIGATEAGRLVEMGSRLALGLVADETSTYTQRMLDAGVQILGRTAVPEFAQHGTTESDAFGPTRNPLDPTVSAGGSSGGAAAAVRAGVVPIAHASDAAGSIRIPASVTGLLGLKPTRDRVPASADRWRGLVCEFVLGRSVRDLHICLDVLTDSDDRSPAPGRQRIALSLDHWAGLTTEPGVRAATEATARKLETLGHDVEPIGCPFDYERLMSTWFPLFGGGIADMVHAAAAATGRPIDAAHLEPSALDVLRRVAEAGDDGLADARATAAEVTSELGRNLAGYDVLLTPTLDQAVIPLERMASYTPMDQYMADGDLWFDRLYLANVTGWPAMSLPAEPDPETSRLSPPIGVQLMARPNHERLLLQLAEQLTARAVIPAV